MAPEKDLDKILQNCQNLARQKAAGVKLTAKENRSVKAYQKLKDMVDASGVLRKRNVNKTEGNASNV